MKTRMYAASGFCWLADRLAMGYEVYKKMFGSDDYRITIKKSDQKLVFELEMCGRFQTVGDISFEGNPTVRLYAVEVSGMPDMMMFAEATELMTNVFRERDMFMDLIFKLKEMG